MSRKKFPQTSHDGVTVLGAVFQPGMFPAENPSPLENANSPPWKFTAGRNLPLEYKKNNFEPDAVPSWAPN